MNCTKEFAALSAYGPHIKSKGVSFEMWCQIQQEARTPGTKVNEKLEFLKAMYGTITARRSR